MLQNAYFLAKIGADTAENEQHFAEILPTDALALRRRPRRRGLPNAYDATGAPAGAGLVALGAPGAWRRA